LHQHTVTISTSIGIAFYPMHAIDAEELMRLADNALYLAKAQGRNCYKVAIQNR
jgi:diguanylate cyclase (GGDEF)-like protein